MLQNHIFLTNLHVNSTRICAAMTICLKLVQVYRTKHHLAMPTFCKSHILTNLHANNFNFPFMEFGIVTQVKMLLCFSTYWVKQKFDEGKSTSFKFIFTYEHLSHIWFDTFYCQNMWLILHKCAHFQVFRHAFQVYSAFYT